MTLFNPNGDFRPNSGRRGGSFKVNKHHGPFPVRTPFTSKRSFVVRGGPRATSGLFGGIVRWTAVVAVVVAWPANAAEKPLHERVDALIAEAHPAGQAPLANDADFLRRAYLTLHGVIPTAAQARAFFADTAPDKRAKVVETLVADPQFARWMAVRFDVMLMERRAETHTKAQDWRDWLEQSFAENKPWDALVREIFSFDGSDEKTRHIARWLLEREADQNALAKDTARLFLGRDISCAQCHNHPRIDDYSQRDYAGLQAFFSRTYLFRPDTKKPGMVAEQATGETSYVSVFTKAGGDTRPRLPAEAELSETASTEWVVEPNPKDKNVRPVPKYSRRALIVQALGDGHHPAFRRNIANRLWAVVFGTGLVEPLDLHHSANPPSNPALLDLLTEQIAAMKFDMRAFIRELALTEAFQRSIDLPPQPSSVVKEAAEKLPSLEQQAATLTAQVEPADSAFGKAQKAVAEVQRAAAPLREEQAKQETEMAKVKKAMDAATAEQKKSSDAFTAKQAEHKTLAEAMAKAQESGENAGAPPKPLQAKMEAAEKAMIAAEKDVEAKTATVESQAKAFAEAERKAAAAKAKLDEAGKQIAEKQQVLDKATEQMQATRIKAKHATQLAAEVKATVDWSTADAAKLPEARETLTVAWGRSFAAMELQALMPEQLCWSGLQASGLLTGFRDAATKEWDAKNKLSDADKEDPEKQAARTAGIDKLFREKVRAQEGQFVKLFGGAAGGPQTDFFATPEQALYFENGGVLRGWAAILANRAAAQTDARGMAEEMYLSTLTRLPDEAEVAAFEAALSARPPEKKVEVLGDFAWALLSSNEFRFAH